MFDALPFAAGQFNHFWFALPLVMSGSLVYAAVRQEEMGPIVRLAVRAAVLIAVIMAVLFAILLAMSWWVSA